MRNGSYIPVQSGAYLDLAQGRGTTGAKNYGTPRQKATTVQEIQNLLDPEQRTLHCVVSVALALLLLQ